MVHSLIGIQTTKVGIGTETPRSSFDIQADGILRDIC